MDNIIIAVHVHRGMNVLQTRTCECGQMLRDYSPRGATFLHEMMSWPKS